MCVSCADRFLEGNDGPILLAMTEKLGFIGMGRMGTGMVARLIGAGYGVSVYDRSKKQLPAVPVARSPRDLAANSEAVLVSVTDDVAVEAVMFGPDGALAGLKNGSRVIDLSTVSPAMSRRLYQAAREKGSSMIDAAVSGSVPQVEEGSLVIFVGGDQETYQRCRPILKILGKNIFYMGSSGMGTTTKLVVNTLLGLGMQSLAEAIGLGLKAGLEKDLLLQVLAETAVMSPSQKSKLANAKNNQYPTQFALSLMHKDLGLVMRQAAAVSAAMPATAAAEQMYTAAMAKGKEEDFSVVIRLMQELAGVSL
jgi:3-hydroxyisobutyrate dehydrogenase-like beta-hydroxyacid dehydrogenase